MAPHGAGMNHTTNPTQHQLDDLRSEWQIVSRTKEARSAVAIVIDAHAEVDLAALLVRDLADLVVLLEPDSALNQLARAQVVATMLRLAPLHHLIGRALLQTLLPGVVSVARRLHWGASVGEEPAVFLADLITAAYELIVEWGGQQRPYAAPDLLNALRCRMRRRMDSMRRDAVLSLDDEGRPIEPVSSEDPDPWESLEGMLRELGESLDPVGAAALYGREVLGYSYRELAVMTGVSARTLSEAGKAMARRILR